MVIRQDVGFPAVKIPYPSLRFGMGQQEPIAIEIEPVMIGAATGQTSLNSRLLASVTRFLLWCIFTQGRKAMQPVGVVTRIE